MSRLDYKLPKPKYSEKFEDMVKDCAKKKYGKKFALYGRRGQNQHGIDVFDRDFDTVIQCKNYKDAKRLNSAIKDDYVEAKSYFLNKENRKFKTFIIATTVNTDEGVQKTVIEMNSVENPDVTIEEWFWEDIEEIILDRDNTDLLEKYYEPYIIDKNDLKMINTANERYIRAYCEPLFLHRDIEGVNLKNLFVMQKYTESFSSVAHDDLEDRIKRFIDGDKKFLFIEGGPGCGKSTLVSRLNYMAKNEKTNIFGDRDVITIRLRDLDRPIICNGGLSKAILKYMKLDPNEEFNILTDRFPQAVMILDGFDELCMIEGIADYDSLIYKFHQDGIHNYKYIITSRPQYIRYYNPTLKEYIEKISLQHFDREKRAEWIEHYTSAEYCGQPLNEGIRKYIENISAEDEGIRKYIKNISAEDEDLSVICDTPMMLYLLAANNISVDLMENPWKLYNHIFSKIMSGTPYNSMLTPDKENPVHAISEYAGVVYRISEEIAFKMYLTSNNSFYVLSDEIQQIIEDLSVSEPLIQGKEKENARTAVKQSCALCNYWKENSEEGAVEFYHNNIRDFFLCEKICRSLSEIYKSWNPPQVKVKKLIEFFLNFKKARLDDMVIRFIKLRAEKEKDNPASFVFREKQQRLLPFLFEELLTNGLLYDNLGEQNHVDAIMNILLCTAVTYRQIYDSILEENEYIKWWNDPEKVDSSHMLKYLFAPTSIVIDSYRFIPILDDSNQFVIKPETSSRLYIYLWERGDFSHIDFSGCNLRSMKLSGANLCGAKLCEADLSEADLSGAILSGANLISATLPDGFQSWDQEEQVQHLKETVEGIEF